METTCGSVFSLLLGFSAKYFPSGSIFKAKVASRSYAWQSIAKVRNLVQTGLLWIVGTKGRLTSTKIGSSLEETWLVFFLQRMGLPQIEKS